MNLDCDQDTIFRGNVAIFREKTEIMRFPFLCTILFVEYVCALRILMFNPTLAHSPMRFMGAIADVLIDGGHELVEVRPIMDTEYSSIRTSKNHRIIEIEPDPRVETIISGTKKPGGMFGDAWYMDPSPLTLAQMAQNFTDQLVYTCEHILMDTNLIADLKTEKFDVGITEGLDFCGNGLFEAIGLRTVITTSSTILQEHQALLLGVPVVPSYVPGGTSGTSDQMTFVERAANGLDSLVGQYLFLGICDRETELFRKKFGKDFMDLRELVARSSLVFTNSNPYLDFPRPTIHKVVDVGGVAIKEKGKLDKMWDEILNRKARTVLISFGSIAKAKYMPPDGKRSVLKTVANFPDVQFVWKYEDDDLTDLPENVFLSKWTPQEELLADGRLSLFVTHGGMASTIELAFGGTPAVVVPIFVDQHRNARMLQRHGSAETFDKFDIADSDKLSALIGRMLEDERYAKNAKELANRLNNAPFKPKEVLLKNVEFVGRFGPLRHLDPYGRRLSFAEYFLLDAIAACLIIISVVLYLVFLIGRNLFAFFAIVGKKKSE